MGVGGVGGLFTTFVIEWHSRGEGSIPGRSKSFDSDHQAGTCWRTRLLSKLNKARSSFFFSSFTGGSHNRKLRICYCAIYRMSSDAHVFLSFENSFDIGAIFMIHEPQKQHKFSC